jgi:hypothetical protein
MNGNAIFWSDFSTPFRVRKMIFIRVCRLRIFLKTHQWQRINMPFVFGIVGVTLLVAGVRGQSSNLFALVKSDFSGQPNYFEWMIAIFAVGAIGYIKELSTISRMFMFLVAAGLLYQNTQVFGEVKPEETATPAPLPNLNTPTSTNPLGIPAIGSISTANNPGGLPALTNTLPDLADYLSMN